MYSIVIDAKDAGEFKQQVLDLAATLGNNSGEPRARAASVPPGGANVGSGTAPTTSPSHPEDGGADLHDKSVSDGAADSVDDVEETDVISASALKSEPKKGRGRPPKAKEVEQQPPQPEQKAQEEFDPFDTTPAKAAAPTFEDVKQALTQVNLKRGLPAAKQLLKAAGASRIGEIKPETYASFIAACEKTLA